MKKTGFARRTAEPMKKKADESVSHGDTENTEKK
jgi:hypothetical protein